MEELNGVTIYWLISIGLIIGYLIDLILGKKGVSLAVNLVGGLAGSVIIGIIAILFQLYGALAYATIGSIALLFLVNVFNMEPEYEETAGLTKK